MMCMNVHIDTYTGTYRYSCAFKHINRYIHTYNDSYFAPPTLKYYLHVMANRGEGCGRNVLIKNKQLHMIHTKGIHKTYMLLIFNDITFFV